MKGELIFINAVNAEVKRVAMRHSEEQEEGVGTEQRSRKASRSSRLRRTEIKKMKDTVEWSMKSSWEVLCGAAGGHKSGRSLE